MCTKETGISAHKETGISAHKRTGISAHKETGTCISAHMIYFILDINIKIGVSSSKNMVLYLHFNPPHFSS